MVNNLADKTQTVGVGLNKLSPTFVMTVSQNYTYFPEIIDPMRGSDKTYDTCEIFLKISFFILTLNLTGSHFLYTYSPLG